MVIKDGNANRSYSLNDRIGYSISEKLNNSDLHMHMLKRYDHVFDEVSQRYSIGDLVSIKRPLGEASFAHWHMGQIIKRHMHIVIEVEKLHLRREQYIAVYNLPQEYRSIYEAKQKKAVSDLPLSYKQADDVHLHNENIHIVDQFYYSFTMFCPMDNFTLYQEQYVKYLIVEDINDSVLEKHHDISLLLI